MGRRNTAAHRQGIKVDRESKPTQRVWQSIQLNPSAATPARGSESSQQDRLHWMFTWLKFVAVTVVATDYLQWRLALWRSVLFNVESPKCKLEDAEENREKQAVPPCRAEVVLNGQLP
ncbi:hypothetical protein NQZ68_007081 [Dissostichus eleginoides]|nr:hypothetical protein NQZ68_007081 [Dissostichus eleginoides]